MNQLLRDELANIFAVELAAGRIVPLQSEGGGARTPTRRYYLRRIRWLAESYGLGWQIDQATLGHPLTSMHDDDLRALLTDMEAGRRCCVEGVGHDEAGLVREASGCATDLGCQHS